MENGIDTETERGIGVRLEQSGEGEVVRETLRDSWVLEEERGQSSGQEAGD